MYLGPVSKPFHKTECQCEECLQWMVDEIDRLQAIVDKLPVDKQGDPIIPNTTRYYVHPCGKVCEIDVGFGLDMAWTNYDGQVRCYRRELARDSYSTREAAQAEAKQ